MSYLLTGISAAGDDGDSADLEELHLVRFGVVGICWVEDCVVVNRDREFDTKFRICGLAIWGKRGAVCSHVKWQLPEVVRAVVPSGSELPSRHVRFVIEQL